MNFGLILVALVLAGFAFMVIYFPLRTKKRKQIWNWPKGNKVTGTYSDCSAHVIFTNVAIVGYTDTQVAELAAKALYSTVEACKEFKLKPPRKEIVVHICSDEAYQRLYDSKWNTKSAGMLQRMYRQAGDEYLVLVAVRGSKYLSTLKTGSLVAHELIHYVIEINENRDFRDVANRNHDLEKYWEQYQGSLENRARELFKTL